MPTACFHIPLPLSWSSFPQISLKTWLCPFSCWRQSPFLCPCVTCCAFKWSVLRCYPMQCVDSRPSWQNYNLLRHSHASPDCVAVSCEGRVWLFPDDLHFVSLSVDPPAYGWRVCTDRKTLQRPRCCRSCCPRDTDRCPHRCSSLSQVVKKVFNAEAHETNKIFKFWLVCWSGQSKPITRCRHHL